MCSLYTEPSIDKSNATEVLSWHVVIFKSDIMVWRHGAKEQKNLSDGVIDFVI